MSIVKLQLETAKVPTVTDTMVTIVIPVILKDEIFDECLF